MAAGVVGRISAISPLSGSSLRAALVAVKIGVAEVEPNSAVVTQHAVHFLKYGYQFYNILPDRILLANLTGHTIISQSEVRRACYAGLDATRLARAEDFEAIAYMEVNAALTG